MVSFLKDLAKGYDGKLPIKKRRLSERSHLTIEFPQSDNRVIRTFVPFLENPTISEKGKANLNSYNLVGRAGQLFSYGGAESRKLTVNFNITLLHVMEEEKDFDYRMLAEDEEHKRFEIVRDLSFVAIFLAILVIVLIIIKDPITVRPLKKSGEFK